MASYNKIIVIGYLGRDPEIRILDNNRKVANFSVATSERYTDKNGVSVEKTEWFTVSFWGQRADTAAQYLKKGTLVYVDGRLSTRQYTDQSGQARFSLEVLGSEFQILSPKQSEGNEYGSSGGGESRSVAYQPATASSAPVASPADFASTGGDDDLPF